MKFRRLWFLTTAILLMTSLTAWGQKRKIIIDQDAAGPAGTDQQSILLLIQSPQTEVLGITIVTGDQWLKAEIAHTLRMLEIIGRTDIQVMPGAEYPHDLDVGSPDDFEHAQGEIIGRTDIQVVPGAEYPLVR